MNYSPYLKNLGMTRKDFFRLKHFGIRNEFERLKYGTCYHEMWSLDVLLCCEIYVRLKHMYKKYHYLCSFADHAGVFDIQSEAYEKEAERRYKEVLNSLEHVIMCYCTDDPSNKYEVDSDEWWAYQNRIRQGFKYLGEGLWGVGI